jgi:UDP-2,3-diacylglucosamine hydrolase
MSTTSSAQPAPLPDSAEASIDHLGLVAGEGDFPLLVARAARSRAIPVTAIGVLGVTSPELETHVSVMHWVKFGQFDRAIRLLQSGGVRKLIMVGRVKHSDVFKLTSIDMRGLKLLGRLANKKADTILGVIAQELAKEDLEVIDSTLFLRDCMPPPGLLTPNVPPSREIMRDIEFGIEHAKSLAGLDIGQSIVVKSQTVVAVEAMEGTDATILRAGEVAGDGIVLCKVAKPRQDKRFDVPVLGLTTVRKIAQAGGAAIAFPGREVLFFDLEAAVAEAEANRICILAV